MSAMRLEKRALGALAPSPAVPAWAWTVGSYAGAWAGGAGVGYVVARSKAGAITGGLATSGIWALAAGIRDAKLVHPGVTAAFLGVGAGSLYLAWKRPKR